MTFELSRQVLRVLLVEDDESDATLIRREIQRANGFELYMERVETEGQVNYALHTKTWDIVISDFSLPKLNAIKVLDILDKFNLDLVFVLVSGTISDDIAEAILGDRRVHEYVSKKNIGKLAAVLHREIYVRKAYDQIIGFVSHLLEFRDKETGGHSTRVTDLTVRLARKMKVSETEIVDIQRGAMLHDVGKVGVSDSVLLKPGRLNDEERSQMERHPQIAFELLLLVSHLQKSLDIPYCHHERYDGSGYPRGLKGYEIPLSARIFAVVDVYDAMTSDRPYRTRMSKAFVLDYIEKRVGKDFDPIVVKNFIEVIKDEPATDY